MDAGRRDEEHHLGRTANRIRETVRDARRHEHEIAGLCAQRVVTGADLELALDHVEDLFDLAVDVVARIEPGRGGEFEEGGPAGGALPFGFVGHLRAAQRERLALTGLDHDRLDRHKSLPSRDRRAGFGAGRASRPDATSITSLVTPRVSGCSPGSRAHNA